MWLILRSRIKNHIAKAIDRERKRCDKERDKALAEQTRHYEQMIKIQQDEYEAVLDSLERQNACLKAEARAAQREKEIVILGSKANNRIAADMKEWARRALANDGVMYQEISVILEDAESGQRRLIK